MNEWMDGWMDGWMDKYLNDCPLLPEHERGQGGRVNWVNGWMDEYPAYALATAVASE
jgi:hypothetical protein